VEIDKRFSEPEALNAGCVQGSVLGPKLFNIYCKDLKQHIGESHLVSYADDSYVTVKGKTLDELKQNIEQTLENHQNYMEEIGMVINKDKTELIVYDKDPNATNEMKLEKTAVSSSSHIKALGIIITKNLCWSKQISSQINKTNRLISSVRHLGRWLKDDDLLKVITSKYFGTIYYAAPVWMTTTLDNKSYKMLNRQHYRALRAVYKDRKCIMSKEDLNSRSCRATPYEWSRYIVASTVIKMMGNSTTPMADKLRRTAYINDRCPGRASFTDISKRKIGRQTLPNRLGFFKDIKFNWCNEDISDDKLQRELKKTFFKYNN